MGAKLLEKLLHFVWQYRLLKSVELKTVNGLPLKIIHPGELNLDSGPDFFNSKIKLGNITLAGNVELHVKSGDWMAHGHQYDSAYNNIILHAVYKYDKPVKQNQDYNVEVLELKNYIDEHIMQKYEGLITSKSELPCSSQISFVQDLKLQIWLQRLLTERLEQKTAYINQLFIASQNDYRQTFYRLLARNFGFKVNAEPFELLAKHLPLNIVLTHKQNLMQIEALLYGTAGFLDELYKDAYLVNLQNEYEFLKNKYRLVSLDKKIWKFSKLMPANFPTVRLWQFAAVIHKSEQLFLNPIKFASLTALHAAVSHASFGYWQRHYTPEGALVKNIDAIGKTSTSNIIINTLAPFLFFYGKQTGQDLFTEAALNSFEEIGFENNKKTRLFTKCGLKFNTAGQSQSLIQLYDKYCSSKQCLKCAIASNILTEDPVVVTK